LCHHYLLLIGVCAALDCRQAIGLHGKAAGRNSVIVAHIICGKTHIDYDIDLRAQINAWQTLLLAL
jgi:hypothetical protein